MLMHRRGMIWVACLNAKTWEVAASGTGTMDGRRPESVAEALAHCP